MFIKCLSIFPLEALLFPFAPTFVFLVRSFVEDSLDHVKGGEVSRVSIARGRRSSQARCPSALKGLEAPQLLKRARFTKEERNFLAFSDTWGGGSSPW